MGSNDAREMLAAAQAECVRLERELAEAKLQIAEFAKASYGGISEHVHNWQAGAPGSQVLWCACGQSRWGGTS